MPQVSLTALVAAVAQGDRLISFPTDTVPALASAPDHAALIFAAKQRPDTKPLILMGAEAADLWPFVQGTPAEIAGWQAIAHRYWPGALTLVLPASDRLPPALNPLNPTTIGIRVPNRAIARTVLARTGPLATTSVNRTGEPPLLTTAAINAEFPQVLTLHPAELEQLEQGERSPQTALNVPSTVLQWQDSQWHYLRSGAVEVDPLLLKGTA
ncbi:MAG: L-threonylcarbamoyladenylate synthase [Kaiparowitsia implicata GSE-PSE-MK54-09C]|jgi:L-threonylcarbamoyladenylate synthase|nr:L-threonylcarbamoyladenylate synthase [Kaiparowitsia implicata GSE-PSE-MK54-09C]